MLIQPLSIIQFISFYANITLRMQNTSSLSCHVPSVRLEPSKCDGVLGRLRLGRCGLLWKILAGRSWNVQIWPPLYLMRRLGGCRKRERVTASTASHCSLTAASPFFAAYSAAYFYVSTALRVLKLSYTSTSTSTVWSNGKKLIPNTSAADHGLL